MGGHLEREVSYNIQKHVAGCHRFRLAGPGRKSRNRSVWLINQPGRWVVAWNIKNGAVGTQDRELRDRFDGPDRRIIAAGVNCLDGPVRRMLLDMHIADWEVTKADLLYYKGDILTLWIYLSEPFPLLRVLRISFSDMLNARFLFER